MWGSGGSGRGRFLVAHFNIDNANAGNVMNQIAGSFGTAATDTFRYRKLPGKQCADATGVELCEAWPTWGQAREHSFRSSMAPPLAPGTGNTSSRASLRHLERASNCDGSAYELATRASGKCHGARLQGSLHRRTTPILPIRRHSSSGNSSKEKPIRSAQAFSVLGFRL